MKCCNWKQLFFKPRCVCHRSPIPLCPSTPWVPVHRLKRKLVVLLSPPTSTLSDLQIADTACEEACTSTFQNEHHPKPCTCCTSTKCFTFPSRFSKHGSKDGRSHDELELPKELTEDWVTMEVCVDCKKFITDIITSSKRSLSMATKRARLNRKTQSFYMSSSSSVNFKPMERTINEVWSRLRLCIKTSLSPWKGSPASGKTVNSKIVNNSNS